MTIESVNYLQKSLPWMLPQSECQARKNEMRFEASIRSRSGGFIPSVPQHIGYPHLGDPAPSTLDDPSTYLYQISHSNTRSPSPETRGAVTGQEHDPKVRRYATPGSPTHFLPAVTIAGRSPRHLPSDHRYEAEHGNGGAFAAREFRAICPRAKFESIAKIGEKPGVECDEDCLGVNIWTPVENVDRAAGEKDTGTKQGWPVFLWLHGGWFQIGDPSQEAGMDPTELIATGGLQGIVVAIGYRLNIFGYLARRELRDEDPDEGGVGNYGLWDVRCAMQWVRENIGAFGGDPGNVTLAGRSAGAYSVHAHVLHECRKRKTFVDETVDGEPRPLEECQPRFQEVYSHCKIEDSLSGKDKLSALRKISAEDLVAAIKQWKDHTFRPITDEDFITSGMTEEFKSRGLRLLIGEMAHEESLDAVYNPPEANAESLYSQIANYYGATMADRVVHLYEMPDSSDEKEWRALYGRIVSEGVRVQDVWRYQIAYRMSFIDENVAAWDWGVTHAMDRPVWNFSIMHGPMDEERVLMDEWIKDLVAFVNDDKGYVYGTTRVDEMKVMRPEKKIKVQKDGRWEELLQLADHFSGK
ncbi:related to acetylcholinesterase precursor [Rhynchosporium graminicola]|uniref:Carboxylic ester hydrolase n=1 Tax=Rhynchosporium graminicola TaxID=2792576 RepID=A0A1E1KJG5_9HELO|nr:related to acetylcholinesterase precursor [Rhynchosporium commune]